MTEPTTTSTLPGLNVLLMGPAGTGKTYSIGSLVETGIEVFYLALEPGLETLMGYWSDSKKSIPENLHWSHVSAPVASIDSLLETAQKINTLSFESLTKMQDPNRTKHNSFTLALQALADFKDERTGKSYGNVSDWGTDRAIVIDGLTGLNRAAMSLVIGNKPVKTLTDWTTAQDMLERFLRYFTECCRCHFILIGHVERETDAVLGGSKISVSTLGRALGPKIPPMFSEVILTVRDGNKWSWDTGNGQADVKTRNLPFASGLSPSFKPVIDKWKERSKAMAGS